MVGYDDAAMVGLGAVNAGVQIAGQMAQKRQQKKLTQMDRAQQARHFQDQMKNLQLEKEDVDRQAQGVGGHSAQQNNREAAAEAGRLFGSQVGTDRDQIEGERKRRQEALDRQITLANADWMDQQRAWKIQRKMQKTQELTGMISTMLLQGASGIGAAKGASALDANGERHAF